MKKISSYLMLFLSIILWIYYLAINWKKLSDDTSSSIVIVFLYGLLIVLYIIKEIINSRNVK